MEKRSAAPPSPGSPHNPIPLEGGKKMLQAYYAGERLPSPLGGQLHILGVREGEGGAGKVLMECNASSLRYLLAIPKATRKEKETVKEALSAGDEPTCPRHGNYQRLGKSGRNWVCSLCGVSYGKSS